MEVLRLEVESELHLPGSATAMPDLSYICELCHRLWQCLSEAGDRTCNLMVPSQICFRCATIGIPLHAFLLLLLSGMAEGGLRSSQERLTFPSCHWPCPKVSGHCLCLYHLVALCPG